MLEVGDTAPAFSLPGTDGEEIEPYSLAEFVETGAVVLLFYPFDFSPVCTDELCEFRDSAWLTLTPGLDVFGVSTDSAYAHREVVRQHELPFPLLSDHDGRVSAEYGVRYEELEGHPNVSKRAVFVVDDSRAVRYAWVADEWLTDPDVRAVNEAVRDIEGIDVTTAADG